MQEFIYQDNGKYYRELTDLLGKSIHKEEITEQEYNGYKETYKELKEETERQDNQLHDEYLDQLIGFRNQLTDMVENCDNREPLYEKDFTISFNGLSVNIGFGATEFYVIQEALDNIIEEQL